MPLASGVRLGAYEVLSLVGAGGMGEVYRARDTRLGRTVALKVLSPSTSGDDTARHRLFREARTVSSLDHPNICALYDVGQDGGIDYLVMQYLEGETLAAMLRRGPLPLDRALQYAGEILTALEAAHHRGIVHRDLKPANVMITAAGARLLDFGLAILRPRPDAAADSTITQSTQSFLTGPGILLGTLPYMAPEQFEGQPADARSDIFSFGAVFYEMLTGRRAFVADDAGGVMTKIIGSTPPLPSHVNHALPAVDGIVARCLAKRPSERWQSVADLRSAVTELRDRSGASHVPRWAYAVTAAVLIAIGGVLAVLTPSLWQRTPAADMTAPAATILAVLPLDIDSADPGERAYWQGMRQAVTSALAQLPPAHRIHVPTGDTARTVRTAADARIELGASRLLRGRVRRTAAGTEVDLELTDPAGRVLRRTTVAVRRSAPADAQNAVVNAALELLEVRLDQPDRAPLVVREAKTGADDFYLQGLGYLLDYDRPENIDIAVTLLKQALDADPDHALAYAGLGQAFWRKYVDTRDTAWVDRARSSCERALGLDEAEAAPHLCLATVEKGIGRYERSVQEYLHALEREAANEQAYLGLADAYEKLKQPQQAEETYRQAIALRPRYWLSHSALGAFYFRERRHADAEASFRQVIALHPDSWRAYSNLGGVHYEQQRPREAVAALERSLALRPNAQAASNLGTIYFFELADYARAAAAFRKALDLNSNDYVVWGNYGWALHWGGDAAAARQAFTRAIALAEERRRVNARDAAVVISLAEYQGALGRKDLARSLVEAAVAIAPDDPRIAFRAGVIFEHSLQDRQQALAWLQHALENGQSFKDLERSPDLERMRRDGDVERLRKAIPSQKEGP